MDLHRKARAYFALLSGRNMVYSFSMLRANAVRKARSRDATACYHRAIKKRAFHAWRFRMAMGEDLERRMRLVFRSVRRHLRANTLACVQAGYSSCIGSLFEPCVHC